VPPLHTSQPGIHLCGSAQIVNGTLNVDEAITPRGTGRGTARGVGVERPRPRLQAVLPPEKREPGVASGPDYRELVGNLHRSREPDDQEAVSEPDRGPEGR